jgi:hypothetical protein
VHPNCLNINENENETYLGRKLTEGDWLQICWLLACCINCRCLEQFAAERQGALLRLRIFCSKPMRHTDITRFLKIS